MKTVRRFAALALVLAATATLLIGAEPAHDTLSKAYEASRERRYDEAITLFLQGIAAAPDRVPARKDLAYLYLKVGDEDAAREQFGEVMKLDPADAHAALEYAFLCFETKRQAEARRVFDRIRREGGPEARATAEQAFQNIDEPLRIGIERWQTALEVQPDDVSAHQELARLAEHRDNLELAAEHYRRAWQLKPERRFLLVDLGRMLRLLNRETEAVAVLLAASRGGEPYAAEQARELLPARYPYVYEFEQALELDPRNSDLRRELGFLLLRMNRQVEAERHFLALTEANAGDLLAAAQLGFLYLARKDAERAMPLLERVISGDDEELANRVRAVLRMPQSLRKRAAAQEYESVEAKLMAERSIKAGYLKDALRYLHIAHEGDPLDFGIMYKLGWTYNLLGQDYSAVRWFDLARRSPDVAVSRTAARSFQNLRSGAARFRTTTWIYPVVSSRWRDVFSYGQVKTEWNVKAPVRPYASIRMVADARGFVGSAAGANLSENAVILAGGAASRSWHGLTAWAEAGTSIAYRRRLLETPGNLLDPNLLDSNLPQPAERFTPDYRGGLAFARTVGASLWSETPGASWDVQGDGVYFSRFNSDVLLISQNRLGYVLPPAAGLRTQMVWNFNWTADTKRQDWANFAETGPGLRLRWTGLPRSAVLSFDMLRGAYTRSAPLGRAANFFDVRSGFWYAFSR